MLRNKIILCNKLENLFCVFTNLNAHQINLKIWNNCSMNRNNKMIEKKFKGFVRETVKFKTDFTLYESINLKVFDKYQKSFE